MPARARRKEDGEAFIAAHNKNVRPRNNALALGQAGDPRMDRPHRIGQKSSTSAPPLIRPSGTFSPYSDGEEGLAVTPVTFLQRRKLAKAAMTASFSPSLYGEKCPAGQ